MIAIYIAAVGLILSVIFSSSEIALISCNRLQITVWQKQKRTGAGLAFGVLEKKEEYLTTILFGTNFSNILATSFATVYLYEHGLGEVPTVILIALIILLFGEILPKSLTRDHPNSGLLLFSPILVASNWIFSPFNFLLRKTGWVHPQQTEGQENEENAEERDDLQYLYNQVRDRQTMEKDQQEMIANVFDFGKATVSEAITPRTEISAVSTEFSLDEALDTFIQSGHSKLPVYENDIDNIIGVIHLYDFFKEARGIDELIKPILFIPFSKSIMDTLSEFRTARHAMAIVLDEHGGTAGLVTAEDLFEELFGDFEDEFDSQDHISEKQSDGSIIASAGMDWDVFNERHGEMIPEGDYETVGGFVLHELGRIPNKGERLHLSIGQVVIRKADTRKIEQLQIFPKK